MLLQQEEELCSLGMFVVIRYDISDIQQWSVECERCLRARECCRR